MLKNSDDLAKILGRSNAKTQLRKAHDLVITQMATAGREWDGIISQFQFPESRKLDGEIVSQKAEDDLAAWLDGTHLSDDEDTHPDEHMTHRKVKASDIAFYRCSWCSNPSAALRKCSVCENAR